MLTLTVPEEQPEYPDLADIFPVANRMQRALFDLLGVRAMGADDNRQWLRHALLDRAGLKERVWADV